ncbi:MAG: polysaccharide deacetylase [Ruminococcaceae bacterium]|nr:polysaccharide deacetylase [Oscillospiraceae bacterium]
MANIFMRFPGGKKKALTLSYDDGVEQDIRLVEILNRHGLKGTFNINSGLLSPEGTVHPKGKIHRVMTKQQCLDLWKDSPHEVAVHSLTHPQLEILPPHLITRELLDDRRNIEQMFGTVTRGGAYPYGTYNQTVLDCMKACGLVYARTVRSTHSFTIPQNWLELPATCHHKDEALPELTDRFVNDTPPKTPWLFYVWGHSYEFEESDNWHIIEEFAAKVGGKDDIWYATNIEIYDYVHSFEQLQISVDGTLVINPTAHTIHACIEGQEYAIPPRDCVRI